MDEWKNESADGKNQGFSLKEYQLIRELVKTRLENKQELEYESFEGYEIPPRTQFSMLKKAAVTFKDGHMTFNMASIHLFEGISYVIPMFNKQTRHFAVIPCSEEEPASVEWARIREKDNAWVNKAITARDFVDILFHELDWNPACRYKVLGNLCLSPRGIILVFDLGEAIMFAPEKEEYVDPRTGDVKKRDMRFYANKYKDRIGMSYSDYESARQMNLFADFPELMEDEASGTAANGDGGNGLHAGTGGEDNPFDYVQTGQPPDDNLPEKTSLAVILPDMIQNKAGGGGNDPGGYSS